MPFVILTDTSANIPNDYLEAHEISIVPFTFYMEGEEYHAEDTRTFDGTAFFRKMRSGVQVSTSQINPQLFEEFFEPYLAAGREVLFISMSSGISGSYNSSLMAIESLRERYPEARIASVDTRAASLGEGISVFRAVECREAGWTLEDTVTDLLSLRDCVYQVFTVDDLKYLMRTGRLYKAAVTLTSMLNIKPLLKGNEEGRIVLFRVSRGRKKAIEALANRYDELVNEAGTQTVCIAHADCPADAAALEELLKRKNPPKEILTVVYEPVTGSHVGPGTLALFFLGRDDVRSH